MFDENERNRVDKKSNILYGIVSRLPELFQNILPISIWAMVLNLL